MSGARKRRSGGRANRVAARQASVAVETATFIERKIPCFEILNQEALELIEYNADTLLEEVGIEFREAPAALELLSAAGAEIDGERVRFPRGLCRQVVMASAPAEYTQHARNPARTTIIGGDRTVLVPAYGSPFVRDLDGGRRYATIEDFRNFVKLTYMSPGLHHSGGTVAQINPARPALAFVGRRRRHARPQQLVEPRRTDRRLWIVESWPSRPWHHLLNEAAARSNLPVLRRGGLLLTRVHTAPRDRATSRRRPSGTGSTSGSGRAARPWEVALSLARVPRCE